MTGHNEKEHMELTQKIEAFTIEMAKNTKLTENLVQQVSGIGSDLKDFKRETREFQANTLKFQEELSPVKEGLRTVQSLNKIFKWLGLPALGAVMYYLLIR